MLRKDNLKPTQAIIGLIAGSVICVSGELAGAKELPRPDSIEYEEFDDEFTTEDSSEKQCIAIPPTLELVDRVRSRTHENMCRSVAWFDGLFGDEHEFDDRDFRGKLAIGFREDEMDGFDPRVRVRIKTKLPNVSSRLNAFIGRVEEDSYISNTEVDQDSINTVGLRSTNDDEDEWLFGLGYRNPKDRDNGFDYSIGGKLSSGFNPYAKITHRHLFEPKDNNYWRTTQTLFWRGDESFGVSTRLDYTKIMTDRDIVEWDTSAKYTEEAEQWEWVTSTSWHHSFTRTRGLSSRVYVRGEEKNEVSIPEYGLSFTYIREVLRPWLFVETGVDFRWEKEHRDASYKSATRLALQFEMLMGDYYGRGKK